MTWIFQRKAECDQYTDVGHQPSCVYKYPGQTYAFELRLDNRSVFLRVATDGRTSDRIETVRELRCMATYAADRFPEMARELAACGVSDPYQVQADVCRDFYLLFASGLLRQPFGYSWIQRKQPLKIQTIDRLVRIIEPIHMVIR